MTKDEIRTDEEIAEDLAEEASHQRVVKYLDDLKKRYKTLFGDDPDWKLSTLEIQNKIAAEMRRRDLRPYKL